MLHKYSPKLFLLASLAIVGGGFVSPPGRARPIDTTSAPAHAAVQRYAVVVDGLACPFCAYGIEKQFKAIPGVDTVSTDIATETVTVTMQPGAVLDRTAAASAVKKAGFVMHDFHPLAPEPHP